MKKKYFKIIWAEAMECSKKVKACEFNVMVITF